MKWLFVFLMLFSTGSHGAGRRTVAKRTPAINVATTSVVIAPAKAGRKGFIVFNNSANSAYVCLAATCIAAECTRVVSTYTSWEVLTEQYYEGPISAIRNSGSGAITVWEFW